MNKDQKQTEFLNQATELLDKSVDTMDNDTALKLRHIRKAALEHKSKPALWLPVPALAATAAVLVLSVTLWFNQPAELNDSLALEDISLLSTNEDLDFYQELDFYDWLDDEQING